MCNYGLTVRQISEIFNVDPKTIINYSHKTEEILKSNSILSTDVILCCQTI